MIEELHIRDLGVIVEARLEPSAGFTAITGETGAGKTMLLSALDLLLGGKADPSRVRAGAERAVVEGRFTGAPAAALERAADAGAELDDDALILARTVVAQGRSRAHVGGTSVPQGVLSQIGEQLVTVHGQADQFHLRSRSTQRDVVDAFAGPDHPAVLATMRARHAELRHAEGALAEFTAQGRTRALEISSLTTALAEIDDAEPQPGEDLALREEVDRLDNVEVLRSAAAEAMEAMSGRSADDLGAVNLLETAARGLARASEHDPELGTLAEQITASAHAVGELGTELGTYVAGLEVDPRRLDVVHARRAVLGTLGRTYGVPWADRGPEDPPAGSTDAVILWATHARARLEELTGPGQDLESLQQQVRDLTRECTAVAAEITAARRAAGDRLAAVVTSELAGLAMASAQVEVAVEPTSLGASGADDVAIMLVPHPGAPSRPLGQGASGGEISRVMLALEVALADAGEATPTTFVFDEVDAGIGGRTASQVGQRLAELSRTAQVVVVTHLAQVAAYADHHIVVEKDTEAEDGTVTSVRAVSGAERTAELARMLSGETTATALEHAADLLERSGVGR
ncbi:DNA repair protein RecN [Serinibacter arcticus]|uniref:DNA repair protein RecN n=1 Tax=Serinibacter arcticus TaxID=1655435 RepID=A0A2U1ZSM3_9MICO|nr:DNA repair protein RecN [Serinibacter arcticus]PWD49985.1 DNA repair protein RecN [Serinibacter arcticus]